MRRVLIAGCGYLGQATADVFETAGWEVEGWTSSSKSARELLAKPYRVDALDISNARQVAGRPGNFDAVIHCASTRGGDVDLYRSVYLIGARNLLDRFPEAKILFTSSTSVYAQSNGEWVTEESPAEPNQETGKIVCEAEKLVRAGGGNVARLGGIYGPGRSFLLKKFVGGEAIVDPERDRFVNQIHRDDAAAALFLLVGRQSPGGGIYNVVDDQPILQSECYRWLAERLNRPAPPFGRSASKRKRGESNKRVSNAKLRALGWVPRYSTFAKAMGKSILPAAALGQ
jgi:nucleoside-diphosphate-sugar epimerase